MSTSAKILADSIGPNGVRLTSWELRYPLYIHAQIKTHRLLSGSTASLRAIPTAKLIQQVLEDPVMPTSWGKNRPGMQATEELSPIASATAIGRWLEARDNAIKSAASLSALDVHKQVVNRILAPFLHTTTILTGTEWEGWYRLRCTDTAQPEIAALANEMLHQYSANTPRCLSPGEWHRPYITWDDEIAVSRASELNRLSIARCARVSYLSHDGKRDLSKDLELYGKLQKEGHMGPFEHVARAREPDDLAWTAWSGNLRGWTSYRELVDPHFVHVGR